MKTVINTQAQNEVKELLSNYVVTPLKDGITGELENKYLDIQKSEDKNYEKVIRELTSVKMYIDNLRKKLDYSFHFEENENAFEKITDAIDDSSNNIICNVNEANEKASKNITYAIDSSHDDIVSNIDKAKEKFTNTSENIQSEIKNSNKRIHEDIKNNEKSIQKSISEKFNVVISTLSISEESASKELTEIEAQIANLTQLVDSKAAKIVTEIKENFEGISQEAQTKYLESKGEYKTIVSHYNELSNQIDKLEKTIFTNFNENDAKVDKYKNETALAIDRSTSEIRDLTVKKYKIVFIMSLSFGLANFLGIISMLIFYFIK